MKKNLSILIYSLAGGGAEKVTSILLNNLIQNYNVKLFLMNDTIVFDIPKSIDIIYLEKSSPSENSIMKLLKLPFLALKYKRLANCDISLSFMNRSNYINVLAKLFGLKSKVIISERATPSIQHKMGIQGKVNRFLIKHLYNKADLIIANSQGNKKDLSDNFNINNTTVIHNPVDLETIKKLSTEAVDFNFDKFTFVTVGRLDQGKNHSLLIESMKECNANLIIIGDGVLKDELHQKVIEAKLDDKVFLVGFDSNPYKYMAKADAFIFASLYEGFPNVLIEALACELPIISSDCLNGPREILSNTNVINNDKILDLVQYGILVPVNNKQENIKAMQLIIKDDLLRKNYKKLSLMRAKDFSKEKILQQYIEVINN